MHVLAVSGLIGSGKDTVAGLIAEKYGYEMIQLADVLRGMLRKEGIPVTRENLQQYRLKHGRTFLAEECVRIAGKSRAARLIFAPMRMMEDFSILRKSFPGIKLIWVDSPATTRFRRLSGRNRENDPKTLIAFKEQDMKEMKIFDFRKLRKAADYKIQNGGSVEDLRKAVDKLMKEVDK